MVFATTTMPGSGVLHVGHWPGAWLVTWLALSYFAFYAMISGVRMTVVYLEDDQQRAGVHVPVLTAVCRASTTIGMFVMLLMTLPQIAST